MPEVQLLLLSSSRRAHWSTCSTATRCDCSGPPLPVPRDAHLPGRATDTVPAEDLTAARTAAERLGAGWELPPVAHDDAVFTCGPALAPVTATPLATARAVHGRIRAGWQRSAARMNASCSVEYVKRALHLRG